MGEKKEVKDLRDLDEDITRIIIRIARLEKNVFILAFGLVIAICLGFLVTLT